MGSARRRSAPGSVPVRGSIPEVAESEVERSRRTSDGRGQSNQKRGCDSGSRDGSGNRDFRQIGGGDFGARLWPWGCEGRHFERIRLVLLAVFAALVVRIQCQEIKQLVSVNVWAIWVEFTVRRADVIVRVPCRQPRLEQYKEQQKQPAWGHPSWVSTDLSSGRCGCVSTSLSIPRREASLLLQDREVVVRQLKHD